MKITKMRTKAGEVPSTDVVLEIERLLRTRFERAGFITEVRALTRTSIKIGLHMRTFSLDLTKHDRNLYRSQCGDKLTNLPTWDQRVEFNDIVNSVLNKYGISANVKSGPFVIRKGKEAMVEGDWVDQKPEWIHHNEMRGNYIEAIDEREYIEERRVERNKRAIERRKQMRQTKPTLTLVGAS
jgi:hypothetical protein